MTVTNRGEPVTPISVDYVNIVPSALEKSENLLSLSVSFTEATEAETEADTAHGPYGIHTIHRNHREPDASPRLAGSLAGLAVARQVTATEADAHQYAAVAARRPDLVSIDRRHLAALIAIARRGTRTDHDADVVDHAQLIARTTGGPRP